MTFFFVAQIPGTGVMLMLCVTIPKDPTTVRAKMDSVEMAKIALVI